MSGYQGIKNGSVQSAYFDNFAEGFPGQIATLNDPHLIDGFPAEVDLGVGIGVVKGTALGLTAGEFNNNSAPYTVDIGALGAVEADFVGIVIRNSSTKNDANGIPIWEAKDMTPVMRDGRIFVTANQAIAADDSVFLIINDTVAHGFQIGSFSNVALGAGGVDTIELTKALFWKAAAVDDVAIIELSK